jgi:hypothetical protein
VGEIPKKLVVNHSAEEELVPLYSVRIAFEICEGLDDHPENTHPQKYGYIISNYAAEFAPAISDMVQEKILDIGLDNILGEDLNIDLQMWSFHSHADITFVLEYLDQLVIANGKAMTRNMEKKSLLWFESALKGLGCHGNDFSKIIPVMELADTLRIDTLTELLRATITRMKRRQLRK